MSKKTRAVSLTKAARTLEDPNGDPWKTPRTIAMRPVQLREAPMTFGESVEAGILSSLPREEKIRQEVVFELIETETKYNNDLGIVETVFLEPIRQKQLLTKEEITALFSNIEDIISVNGSFLRELKKLKLQGPVILDVGKHMLEWVEPFKVYGVFCSNHRRIVDRIDDFKQKNKPFAKFLEDCFVLPVCRLLSLDSFLMAPLQRICKYPLLLKKICENTPEGHSDYHTIRQATEALENIVKMINEQTREMENIEKILAIQNKIEQNANSEKLELVAPGRHLVRQGLLHVRISSSQFEAMLFLFNDLLLVTKLNKQGNYLLIHSLPLDLVLLKNCVVVEKDFEVVKMGGNSFTFNARTAEEARLWVNDLERYTQQCLAESVRIMEGGHMQRYATNPRGVNAPTSTGTPQTEKRARREGQSERPPLERQPRAKGLHRRTYSLDKDIIFEHTKLSPRRSPPISNANEAPSELTSPPAEASANAEDSPSPATSQIPASTTIPSSASLTLNVAEPTKENSPSPPPSASPGSAVSTSVASPHSPSSTNNHSFSTLPAPTPLTATATATKEQFPPSLDQLHGEADQAVTLDGDAPLEVFKDNYAKELKLRTEAEAYSKALAEELAKLKRKHRYHREKIIRVEKRYREKEKQRSRDDQAKSKLLSKYKFENRSLREDNARLRDELSFEQEENTYLKLQLEASEESMSSMKQLLALYSKQLDMLTATLNHNNTITLSSSSSSLSSSCSQELLLS
ncbi:Rho guanine nucleotide exchange factor 4 [Balamuthia mandrillaris]